VDALRRCAADRQTPAARAGDRVDIESDDAVGAELQQSAADRKLAFGADAARLYSLFAAPPDRDLDWQDTGIEGIQRFLGRRTLIAQLQNRRVGLG